MTVTLLIPELIWSNPDADAVFAPCDTHPLAAKLAAGFTDVPRPASNRLSPYPELLFAQLAGLSGDASTAALRLRGESEATRQAVGAPSAGEMSTLLCADPMHLRFHQERLLLADDAQIALTQPEADALLSALNAHFGAHACFFAAEPTRWYVRINAAINGSWPPPSACVGRSIPSDLFAATPQLARLAQEAQMLLHAHPVNQARESRGAPTANAVWLWGLAGHGATPEIETTDNTTTLSVLTRVVGADALAQGIANARAAAYVELPDSFSALQLPGKSDPESHTLIYLDSLLRPAQYEDASAWLQAWHELADNWLQPALTAFASGMPGQIYVTGAYGPHCWQQISQPVWQQLWQRVTGGRKKSPLNALAHRLAEAQTNTQAGPDRQQP